MAEFNAQNDSMLSHLLHMTQAYQASRAFILAGKLDLFTSMHERSDGMTAADVTRAVGFSSDPNFRGTRDFLDLLVTIKVLDRSGNGPDARYTTAQAAAPYLVKGQQHYIGGWLTVNNDRLYPRWMYLEEALRTGKVPEDNEGGTADIVSVFQDDPKLAEHFAMGMLGRSRGNFQALAHKLDFSKYQTFGDFGGSTGACCVYVVQQNPHICATTYDTPAIKPVAEKFVASQGVADKVQVENFDIFSDQPFPKHDVIAMGMILHDWGLPKKMQLLRKAYDALPPGGAFIAVESLIDDERRETTLSLAMSLNMLVEFGRENSFDFSFEEFVDWCKQVGFTSFEKIKLVATSHAAVAYK